MADYLWPKIDANLWSITPDIKYDYIKVEMQNKKKQYLFLLLQLYYVNKNWIWQEKQQVISLCKTIY